MQFVMMTLWMFSNENERVKGGFVEKKFEVLKRTLAVDLSYKSEEKAEFAEAAKAFLNALESRLDFKEAKVWFNAGGIAVSGEAMLMGMWPEGRGLYVQIGQSFGKPLLMYREIRHMKDYGGSGPNQYIWSPTRGGVDTATADSVLDTFMRFRDSEYA